MRSLAWVFPALLLATGLGGCTPPEPDRPNILFIFVDDLGYGDLGSYGSTTIETPNLDRLAEQGVRFTQFYSGNAVCTPSRAVLMTGRQGPRQVLKGTFGGIYHPDSDDGMAGGQETIAEILHDVGYATALFGKWHLGDNPDFLPTRQGFDIFYGLPYSNDMSPLVLLNQEQIEEELVDVASQAMLTDLYTVRAKAFIREAVNKDVPFFVYYANNFPHIPLAASDGFAGRSPPCADTGATQACGLYADVVHEIDDSVGELVNEIASLGAAQNTIIVFTSDNGPWLAQGVDGGSAGPLREGKGSTFEGGFRVPTIVRYSDAYRRGAVEDAPAVMYDWYTTLATEASAEIPDDRAFDGHDLGPLLRGVGPRDPSGAPFQLVYYRSDNETPGAIRRGRWKYKAAVEGAESPHAVYTHPELLFDLDADPEELNDLAAQNPNTLADLRDRMAEIDDDLKADPLRE